jgi:hypothetical protein
LGPIALAGAASNLLGGLFKVADELFTTDEERDAAKLKIMELHTAGALAQLEVNAVEAKHMSLFVSGWRPFIGWVCGLSFAITFIAQPIVTGLILYISSVTGKPVDLSGLPEIDLSLMMPVLLGMLGLGGLRTYEKVTGTSK